MGPGLTIILILSTEVEQVPLVIVHANVAESPITKPVTPLVGDVGEVMVAVPDTSVHVPVPTVGVFPVTTVDVVLHNF